MRRLIENANATSCSFGSVTITTSEEFKELYPTRRLPAFSWLRIDGIAGRDDFGSSQAGTLVVPDRVLEMMKLARFAHCDICEA